MEPSGELDEACAQLGVTMLVLFGSRAPGGLPPGRPATWIWHFDSRRVRQGLPAGGSWTRSSRSFRDMLDHRIVHASIAKTLEQYAAFVRLVSAWLSSSQEGSGGLRL